MSAGAAPVVAPPALSPPTWRAEMAATRSPLRIRPVPEMPSSPASRCSSGSSRSEEHTSELQSRQYLVCRLLLEKKKTKDTQTKPIPFDRIKLYTPTI